MLNNIYQTQLHRNDLVYMSDCSETAFFDRRRLTRVKSAAFSLMIFYSDLVDRVIQRDLPLSNSIQIQIIKHIGMSPRKSSKLSILIQI